MKLAILAKSPSPDSVSEFAKTGSTAIDNFLTDDAAESLLLELQSVGRWQEIFTGNGKTYEMSAADFEELSDEQRANITLLTHTAALDELQYRYRSIRVSEDPAERADRGLAIDKFSDLMNSPATLQYLRGVTGLEAIDFVDAQATAYRAGSFLTNHDDDVEGKNRLAAYVFSLTPHWSMDWGGLLLLESGKSVSGFIPAFNSLRIFSVPIKHCVSVVAPWVEETRYSITGWLRYSS
ncbi:2OG-Fe(II) oxygenase [Altererythrobacter sp. MF3-039]|uniref:2OG-Fe(II) oxygenase n=1 Tax=Altererythrobacter sp. MF3-039 TaxID=3252901 RepID=UPI00390C6B3D